MPMTGSSLRVLARLAISLAAIGAVAPALAASVEIVAPDSLAASPAAFPGSEIGDERSWVQLVWNPATSKLERRSYSVLDPIASLGLDLTWLPDDPKTDAAGALNGAGTLTFRLPGAPAYDPEAAVARYRGTLVDGRFEGEGEFLHVSGYAYSGGWTNGLMQGQGRLSLPNGDEYSGAFAGGKRDGAGVFIDATGAIYDGRFAADQRDGEGVFVLASGDAYRALWDNGVEISGTRVAVDASTLGHVQVIDAQYETYDDLRIGIVAERVPKVSDFSYEPLSYTSRSEGQTLAIYPDDERLLAVWHGTIPIQMSDNERYEFGDYNYTPSFLGAYERFEPIPLIFELENLSRDDISIVGAYLEVEHSKRDPEPAIQLRPLINDGCAGGDSFVISDFRLDNFGWTPAENANVSLAVAGLDKTLDKPIANVEQSLEVDVVELLNQLGVDTALLATDKIRCTDLGDEAQCLSEVAATGQLGELAPMIYLSGTSIRADIEGTLSYDWRDADGTMQHKASDFSTPVAVGEVYTDAECGEGGEIVEPKHDPFVFALDKDNYRMAIPITADVAAGVTGRWRVKFTAPETSEHDFRLILVLADGREVASRPINLTYFMPPKDFDPFG